MQCEKYGNYFGKKDPNHTQKASSPQFVLVAQAHVPFLKVYG